MSLVGKKWPLPAWLLGAVAGDAIWGLAWLLWYAERCTHWDILELSATIGGLVAFPIALGGWLLVWGDNGPPYPWLNTPWCNFVFPL